MPYKIALVDDNPVLLNYLKSDLEKLEMLDIVFTAASGSDFLAQMKILPEKQHPQVVLMDIEMPVMNGIEAIKNGITLYGETQYIVFSIADDDDKLFEAIKAGADGYLLKDEPPATIYNAITEVIDKTGAPMSPSIARKTLKLLSAQPGQSKPVAAAESVLSEREIQILKGMAVGLNYKQIAEKVLLSPFTVRNHITNIYNKLHITSKAQAVKLAVKNKWV